MDEQNVRSQLSERVKQALSEIGGTQEQLAASLGVSKRIVSYWANGHRTPGLDKLEQISTLSARPLSWFFENDELMTAGSMVTRVQESTEALREKIAQFEFEAIWYRAFCLSALKEMSVLEFAKAVKGHSFNEAWKSVRQGHATQFLEEHVTSRFLQELESTELDEQTRAKALSLLSEVINPWLYAKAEAQGFLERDEPSGD